MVENLFRGVTQQIKVISITVLKLRDLQRTSPLLIYSIQFWEMKAIFIGNKKEDMAEKG